MPQDSRYNPSYSSGQRPGGPSQNPQARDPGRPIKIEAVIQGNDPKLLVEEAQELARRLTDTEDTTITQVRRLFTTFRQIEFAWPQSPGDDEAKKKEADEAYFELVLMKPKLQYQAARQEDWRKRESISNLTGVLEKGIDLVGKDRSRLERLMQFFEATVAYYTAIGVQKKGDRGRNR